MASEEHTFTSLIIKCVVRKCWVLVYSTGFQICKNKCHTEIYWRAFTQIIFHVVHVDVHYKTSTHKLAMPKLEERRGWLRAFTETCLVWSQEDHTCVSRARCSVLYLHINMENVSALKISWVIHTRQMALIVSWHLRAKLCTQVRIKKKQPD